jgi:hypothetical protein
MKTEIIILLVLHCILSYIVAKFVKKHKWFE